MLTLNTSIKIIRIIGKLKNNCNLHRSTQITLNNIEELIMPVLQMQLK